MDTPPISVIIPTYNRAHCITDSVMSVLGQTYENLECIVVDDASTDNTEEKISAIDDSRLKYYRLSQNSGVAKARNTGAELAAYDIIAFNDSDDSWRPEKLKRQIEYRNAHPDDILIYSAYERSRFGPTQRVPSEQYELEILNGYIYPYLLQNNSIGTVTMLMDKALFFQLGGFDSTYPALEDWQFALKAAKTGTIGYINDILVDTYRNDNRISLSNANYYTARCMLIAEHIDNIQKFGLFDIITLNILKDAETNGILEPVKKLMIHYLMPQN